MPSARNGEIKNKPASSGKKQAKVSKGAAGKRTEGTVGLPSTSAAGSVLESTTSRNNHPAQDVVMQKLIKKQAFLKKLGDKRKRYYLSADITTIGSDKSALLSVKDPSVAFMHARIVYKKGEYILFEHEATGQSYVNGVEVTECSLRDGDILRFGSTSYGFFHRSSSWYGGF